ncbi:MAG: galactokinase family protein, partial [Planctomycetes bacterium]|nr:galactokinase family protein [Planctomycetota bacterium]
MNITCEPYKLPDHEISTLESTSNESERVNILTKHFENSFSEKPSWCAKAGGRVNLIGEHVDYPDVQFSSESPA